MNEVPQQEQYPPNFQPQPYYGSPAWSPPTEYPRPPADGLGIASLVLGVATVGFFLWLIPFFGIVPPLVAIPLAVVGLRRVMAGTRRAKGFAVTGLVTGLVGLGLAAFWNVALVVAANDAADQINDWDSYDNCLDHTRLANWDSCDKYLD